MKIILIAGKAQSGKDTLADAICETLPNFIKLDFAGFLKEMAAVMFNFPVRFAYTSEGKATKIKRAAGMTVGEILQKMGTEVCRNINPDLWAMVAMERIEALGRKNNYVISDCRFKNEATYFLSKNPTASRLIYLTRDVALNDGRSKGHASEDLAWAPILCAADPTRSLIIDNNGDVSAQYTADIGIKEVRDWTKK